jgi:Na+/phosphate symporter
MENLATIREKINQMADLALSMLKSTFDGFIKHDLDILAEVLKDEQRLNDMEKSITLSLTQISKEKATLAEKKNIMLLVNIVADLEEIGDYIMDKSLKMNDKSFAGRVLCSREHVDNLVQKYREAHAKRLVAGVCLPRACNMFLNLLDFTAQIAHHTKLIAKNISKIK